MSQNIETSKKATLSKAYNLATATMTQWPSPEKPSLMRASSIFPRAGALSSSSSSDETRPKPTMRIKNPFPRTRKYIHRPLSSSSSSPDEEPPRLFTLRKRTTPFVRRTIPGAFIETPKPQPQTTILLEETHSPQPLLLNDASTPDALNAQQPLPQEAQTPQAEPLDASTQDAPLQTQAWVEETQSPQAQSLNEKISNAPPQTLQTSTSSSLNARPLAQPSKAQPLRAPPQISLRTRPVITQPIYTRPAQKQPPFTQPPKPHFECTQCPTIRQTLPETKPFISVEADVALMKLDSNFTDSDSDAKLADDVVSTGLERTLESIKEARHGIERLQEHVTQVPAAHPPFQMWLGCLLAFMLALGVAAVAIGGIMDYMSGHVVQGSAADWWLGADGPVAVISGGGGHIGMGVGVGWDELV